MLNSFIHNRVASSEGPKSNGQDTFSDSAVRFWSTLLKFILIGTSPGFALLVCLFCSFSVFSVVYQSPSHKYIYSLDMLMYLIS